MEIIKSENTATGKNNSECKTLEYSFADKEIDLCIATITSRSPTNGYFKNIVSKELIYVIEGSVTLCFNNKNIEFKKGDSILIDRGEMYYWDTSYCKVTITCTPAYTDEEHIMIN